MSFVCDVLGTCVSKNDVHRERERERERERVAWKVGKVSPSVATVLPPFTVCWIEALFHSCLFNLQQFCSVIQLKGVSLEGMLTYCLHPAT